MELENKKTYFGCIKTTINRKHSICSDVCVSVCNTNTHTHPDIIVHSHLLPLPIFGMQLIFYSVNFIKICFIPLQAVVSHAWSCTIYTYISKHSPTTPFHVFTPTQTHTGTRFGSNTRRNTAKHRPYFMGNWATTTNTCSFDNTKQRLQHQNLFHICMCEYLWMYWCQRVIPVNLEDVVESLVAVE